MQKTLEGIFIESVQAARQTFRETCDENQVADGEMMKLIHKVRMTSLFEPLVHGGGSVEGSLEQILAVNLTDFDDEETQKL